MQPTMKIVPTSDILISGHHSPAGVPVEVADATGRILIAERLAYALAEKIADQPPIETASAAPLAETAARKPARPSRTTAKA